MTILSLRNVSFSYEQAPILIDVNLEITKGDFVGIFGPNGGGKTTFLQILLGFLTPDTGSVEILGTSPLQARTQIGYVPQNIRMDKQFPITVEEVVEMGVISHLNCFGKLPLYYKQQAQDALEKVGLSSIKKQLFGTLSGGQAQRVLIARALASQPKILLLDEPTASVDPQAEKDILTLLSSLEKTVTILMVTHDLPTITKQARSLLCVHRTIHLLHPQEVCEHFGLGLYHTPLPPSRTP